jgi:ABC-type transporter MlaC component
MLHAAPSPGRDAQVNAALDTFVDYPELVHRSFGEPCHPSMPNCDDLWGKYSDKQKDELFKLLKRVIESSYRKNLSKTLDYDVTYKGSRDAAGDTRVLTEAKSKTNPRDVPVRVDYVVRQTPSGPRVVDIITEGSSFSKNLYVQFRKMDDYCKIVGKLEEKLEEKNPPPCTP